MTYPRGTVLRWTAKAMRSARSRTQADRMIVLDDRTVVWFTNGCVLQTDMLKKQDSFVEPTSETVPVGLAIRTKYMVLDPAIPGLIEEFGFVEVA